MIALSISLHQKVIVVMAYFFDFQFVLQPLILGSCIFVLNIKNKVGKYKNFSGTPCQMTVVKKI